MPSRFAATRFRWNHKTRGLLTPGDFVSIAEKTGAILQLANWVFEEACRQLKLWRSEGIAPPVLSVNVSGAQFKSGAELEREVEQSLMRWDINPGDIELELTESVLMEATQRHGNTLDKLRQLGTKIAIDDFGTGYRRSNLSPPIRSTCSSSRRNSCSVSPSIIATPQWCAPPYGSPTSLAWK
ncbi:MAG TPA: EAL domain-containing protein [Methyloceanibacter sp.]|nr:EAL domain-containing protein [Methyloceanibacter sp.]